jgi:LL-diaminopimelate aminotransferase
MAKTNKHYKKLSSSYLFEKIAKKTTDYSKSHPHIDLINFGIGDITLPLSKSISQAICSATEEMENAVIGYGPNTGYPFLKELICNNEYADLNISPDEIFISNGAKNDSSNIQQIFDITSKVAFCDPIYPVYVDSNVIAGRASKLPVNGKYSDFIYLPCLEENNFLPKPPKTKCDLIYLCSPNNPTGSVFTKAMLKQWVDYANDNNAIILFDGAYEKFITSKNIPHSIYEIEGAHNVAIEFRSFSKTAGFTNLRCSYTIIPKHAHVIENNTKVFLHKIWKRFIESKFGGVPYPIQKGAAATFSLQGKKEIHKNISYYSDNAKILLKELQKLGVTTYGGIDAPYVWCKTIDNKSSWECFDYLLNTSGIITTPGCGFGPSGEGYIRFSSFTKRSHIEESIKRLKKCL